MQRITKNEGKAQEQNQNPQPESKNSTTRRTKSLSFTGKRKSLSRIGSPRNTQSSSVQSHNTPSSSGQSPSSVFTSLESSVDESPTVARRGSDKPEKTLKRSNNSLGQSKEVKISQPSKESKDKPKKFNLPKINFKAPSQSSSNPTSPSLPSSGPNTPKSANNKTIKSSPQSPSSKSGQITPNSGLTSPNSPCDGFSINKLMANRADRFPITPELTNRFREIAKKVCSHISKNEKEVTHFIFDNDNNIVKHELLSAVNNQKSAQSKVSFGDDSIQVIYDGKTKKCYFIMDNEKQYKLGKGGNASVFIGFEVPVHEKKFTPKKENILAFKMSDAKLSAEQANIINDYMVPNKLFENHYVLQNKKSILVMPYYNGPSLYEYLYSVNKDIDREAEGHYVGKRFLQGQEKLQLIKEILIVLEKFHATGLVHRDLKPENLMIPPNVIDLDDARKADATSVTDDVVNSYGYLPPEIQHTRNYTFRSVMLKSFKSPDDINLEELRSIIEDEDSFTRCMTILIKCDDSIFIYGRQDNIWSLTKLDKSIFVSVDFPEITAAPIFITCPKLHKDVLIEIEKHHDFKMNKPYTFQSDIRQIGPVLADIVSYDMYAEQILSKDNPDEKYIHQEDLYQMIPDFYQKINVCVTPKLPEPKYVAQGVTIVTPQGLFQLQDNKYKQVLDSDDLGILNIPGLQNRLDALHHWCLADLDAKYAMKKFEGLKKIVAEKGFDTKFDRKSVYFMLELPNDKNGDDMPVVFTPTGLYVKKDGEYHCVINKKATADFSLVYYFEVANKLVSQKAYIKDLSPANFNVLNKAVLEKGGKPLRQVSLLERFTKDGLMRHDKWKKLTPDQLFAYLEPNLGRTCIEDIDILKNNTKLMIDEIVYQLYILPNLKEVIRLFTQEDPRARPSEKDMNDIHDQIESMEKDLIELKEAHFKNYKLVQDPDPFDKYIKEKCIKAKSVDKFDECVDKFDKYLDALLPSSDSASKSESDLKGPSLAKSGIFGKPVTEFNSIKEEDALVVFVSNSSEEEKDQGMQPTKMVSK